MEFKITNNVHDFSVAGSGVILSHLRHHLQLQTNLRLRIRRQYQDTREDRIIKYE